MKEKVKLKSHTDNFNFRKTLLVLLVVDIFEGMGQRNPEVFVERKKQMKVLLKESVWGKVKTIASIGACHVYTHGT